MICSEAEMDDKQAPIKMSSCGSCGAPCVRHTDACPVCARMSAKKRPFRVVLDGYRRDIYEWCLTKGLVKPCELKEALGITDRRCRVELSVASKARRLVFAHTGKFFTVARLGKGLYLFKEEGTCDNMSA